MELYAYVVITLIFISIAIKLKLNNIKLENIGSDKDLSHNELLKLNNSLQESLLEKTAESVKYKTLFESQSQSFLDRESLLKNNEKNLISQFKNLATEILDKNNEKFDEQSQVKLSSIVKPMQTQLSEFKKTMERAYDNEAEERGFLKSELKELKSLNQKISTEAHNLTTALKGNNKSQGSWGEMILETVLERSGLKKNEEYFREKTFINSENTKYRPDVIVNLPENRQVIIDAKTSLIDYDEYNSTTSEKDKTSHLSNHIKSIGNHIDNLSSKNYEKLQGINTLDFVLMFVPIESALILALENDKNLFDKAFSKKIVLVSPTTLLIALKAVENSWRYEKQARSTEEVIRLAESLYDKVRGFTEDFEKIGSQLDGVQGLYEKAYKKLTSGRGSVIKQIEVFKEKSNIKPKKEISKSLQE